MSAAGLVKLGHVALDGTKIKANASKHKAMSYERMSEAEQKLEQEVAQLLAKAQESTRPRIGNTARGDGETSCQQNWHGGRAG